MWFEIFKFEIQYRLKRADTYVFFLFLLLFSILGVEFIFQGVELGMVKKNAPVVIAKTMGAICALSILIVSMIMGVPILRDFQYGIASIIYVNPFSKKEYLLGKFLGSLTILLFIFSAVLWGMMLGESMPWVKPEEYLPFRLSSYLQAFFWVAVPIILCFASLFFVTGALSKSLLVVYTQGLVLFVLFLLSKAIQHEFLQAMLEPFSLSALSEVNKDWSAEENNLSLLPWSGILLLKNIFWSGIGMLALFYGYKKFQLNVNPTVRSSKKLIPISASTSAFFNTKLPETEPTFNYPSQLLQLLYFAWFEVQYILKQSLFWAIIVSGFVIILINSVDLGMSYHINSYPTTYLIIEELQEMSIYFFVFILLIYTGEIIWKEKEVKLHLITDATPIKSLVALGGKFLGLLSIYGILLLTLILAGLLFQTFKGYFKYDWKAYFVGFFLELLPFLAIYTLAAFFIQILIGRKFIGMIATIVFFIISILVSVLLTDHVLLNFAGNTLPAYSEMNGYGHSLIPYLWIKAYWFIFGLLLLILASILKQRGVETKLIKRWRTGLKQVGKPIKIFTFLCSLTFVAIGSFIFYNTNIINAYWTANEASSFRANYEKTLQPFEYIPQPKITAIHLNLELYPSQRAYEVQGSYQLINSSPEPIHEIHLQKQIADQVEWKDIHFDRTAILNDEFDSFHYYIYQLKKPLLQGDSIQFNFTQKATSLGFENSDAYTDILHNGTFIDNSIFPTIGYQRKYELKDEELRQDHILEKRIIKAEVNDPRELVNARTGSDSDGIFLEMIIGTEQPQTAVTSGNLIKQWSENNRNYFHYKTDQKIINFYSVVSANYELKKDSHSLSASLSKKPIDLEIYYHKSHSHNLDRMMESMKYTLDYCSAQFSAYPFQQIRIMEFPRYRQFAQSFPSAVPFSESIGFMMDINDAEDVDMVFFITAHELAHQWWGIQLEAANVQGQDFILETLAQYSALMVLKEKYPTEKIHQFLELQHEDYTKGIRKQKQVESPLIFVENEEHIYYAKGALNMYALQKQIGEEKVNLALRNFLQDWKTFNNPNRPNRYATSLDLIEYFKEVSPKEEKLIRELFEEVHTIDIETLTEVR